MVAADEQTPLLRGRNDEEHKEENPLKSTDETPPEKKTKPQSGWSSIVIVAVLFSVGIVFEVLIVVPVAFVTGTAFDAQSVTWWALTFVLHIPYFVILVYLFAGLVERVGYMFLDCGCTPYVRNTDLHDDIGYPTVCVQLAMFNEHEVSERIIQAACNIAWATEKLEIQVLDDSTDLVCREIVDRCIADCRKDHPNLSITLQRREKRTGFKAGALEEGRKKTNAMFLALFDADFVPTTDFLVRAVPLFYKENDNHAGSSPKWISDDKLALVQAQWGHLNAFDSPLTMSQSMWIDDHHSVQMMWRARVWDFVNFTGTAGLWRASAIETAGGWKHASLVEDCELSFRVLFSGYRTTFDSSNVQPAELPDSVTAYKAQQKRWTQGWVQLCRMHFGHLIWSYECTVSKRVALIYHMLITWQWPFWLSWLLCFPFMLWYDLTFIALGDDYDLFYIVPMGAWLLFMASLATYKTKYTYKEELGFFNFFFRAYVRLIPYIVINSGMLPHQFCSFLEGLIEPMHAEFERTPKRGGSMENLPAGALQKRLSSQQSLLSGAAQDASQSKPPPRSDVDKSHDSNDDGIMVGTGHATESDAAPQKKEKSLSTGSLPSEPPSETTSVPVSDQTVKVFGDAKIHWYIYAEIAFVLFQVLWVFLFLSSAMWVSAALAAYQGLAVLSLLLFYGDDKEADVFSLLTCRRTAAAVSQDPHHGIAAHPLEVV